MAGKKNSRTSKTDHVLSLLTGGNTDREVPAQSPPPEKQTEQPQKVERSRKTGCPSKAESASKNESTPKEEDTPKTESVPAVRTAAPGHPLSPPILEVARMHNEALSETIREALTETLEQELSRTAEKAPVQQPAAPEKAASQSEEASPPPEASTALETAPVMEGTPSVEPSPSPEGAPVMKGPTVAEAGPVPKEVPAAETPEAPPAAKAAPEQAAPTPPTAIPAPEQTSSGPDAVLPDGSVYLNVMELVVKEHLEKYVKLFGLCSCPRCLADVRALALSRLPAKYVVLPAAAVAPMVSLYRAKFESQAIAQVIQACKIVMESPRHTL